MHYTAAPPHASSDIWCGIPVYNNAATVADVARRAREVVPNVVVVDDGSTDADLRQLLAEMRVDVVRHPANRGKGAALTSAFRHAADRGGRYLITLDGDGQHFPEDIARFIPRLKPDTILLGRREEIVGKMPRSSRFGRRFSDFWIFAETGRRVIDSQSGFRAYPVEPVLALPMWSRHYNFEIEVLTRAIWADLSVESVPVRVAYPTDRVSHFRPFRDNLRITRAHIRLLLRRLVSVSSLHVMGAPSPTIVDVIRSETAALDDHVALIEGNRSISYGQLIKSVAELSTAIRSVATPKPGARVAFWCADGIDYVIGALALLSRGVAVVPVADSLTAAEVEETVDRIDVHGVLIHRSIKRITNGPATVRVDEMFDWQSRAARGDADQHCGRIGAAFIRFSSGTTGQSKGVVLSHETIIDRTNAADRGLRVARDDTILWVLGMSHHFVVSILLFLRRGATIVVANKMFPLSVLQAVQTHPITLIYGSPVHYYLLAVSDAVTRETLSKVRLAVSTSMKLSADVARQFTEKFGIAPAEAYGIIEIGLPFLNTDGASGSATVGKPLPDFEVRIDSPDEDGVGQTFVKGKGMFDAYFSPWRWHDDVAPGGWFATGDLGKLDEAGRLMLLGRSKTVIVTAGMKVFPEEVEEVINAQPGIAESLVWGCDHAQYGQVPVASIVVRAGVDAQIVAADLRRACLKTLSSYKVPVEFVVVERLPKTASGKLVRVRDESVRTHK